MDDLTKHYPVVLPHTVRWGELDAFQHVNNTIYFRYFENARIAYFEQAGILNDRDTTKRGPILASTRCDFRAPLTYPDTIQVGARAERVEGKKIWMRHAVYSESLGRIVAEGEGLVVYYDYGAAKSCDVPPEIITAIDALEATVEK